MLKGHLTCWGCWSGEGEQGRAEAGPLLPDRRVPAELGQESQASSCLRKGTPLASRVAQGVSHTVSAPAHNLPVDPGVETLPLPDAQGPR